MRMVEMEELCRNHLDRINALNNLNRAILQVLQPLPRRALILPTLWSLVSRRRRSTLHPRLLGLPLLIHPECCPISHSPEEGGALCAAKWTLFFSLLTCFWDIWSVGGLRRASVTRIVLSIGLAHPRRGRPEAETTGMIVRFRGRKQRANSKFDHAREIRWAVVDVRERLIRVAWQVPGISINFNEIKIKAIYWYELEKFGLSLGSRSPALIYWKRLLLYWP